MTSFGLRQSNVPSIQEFIRKLSARASLDKGTILVLDNIHEDEQILTLMAGLRKQKPGVTIWCASRISEFVNLRDKWQEISEDFIEREVPGYLDHDSIMLFLDRYRELMNEQAQELILRQENVTAYYLVDVYRQLKSTEHAKDKPSPQDVVAQVSIDVEEDNRKTFGGLDDIERLALKIISYLDMTPKTLLERLLHRSDPEKGKGVIQSLLARGVVFPAERILLTPHRTKVEAICMFDSFEEFIAEQMYSLDMRTVIPGLLLDQARDCQEDIPLALLALTDKYSDLDDGQKKQVKEVILAHRENPVALWITSDLAEKDEDLLQLADHARKPTLQVAPETLAFFGYAFAKHENHAQAIDFLERAIEIKPGRAWWLHTLAHSYEKVGNLENAVKYMEKAVSKDSQYLACLGVLYEELDRDDQALECYQKAIEHNRANAKAWNNMGIIYQQQGDLDKAYECYKTALEIAPEFVWSLLNMASVLREIKDFEQASRYSLKITKALNTQQIEGMEAHLLNNIAYDAIVSGYLDRAAEVLEIGLEKDSNYSYLYATKGLLHFRQGNVDQGRELYEQAISMSPDDLALRQKFHYEHGMTLRIQGKFDDAIEELERALNTASEFISDEQIEVEIWKAKRGDDSG